MKKAIIYLSQFVMVCMMACESDTIPVNIQKLGVSLVYAYSLSNTDGEASVMLSQNSYNVEEVGVVWATKSNPTLADNRQSLGYIKDVQGYTLKMNNLVQGTAYYLRAYYTFQGTTTYSTDEIVFTQNYDPNWFHLPSPVLKPDRYILSGGGFSGSNGGVVYYAVDKNTNMANTVIFYPGSDEWNLRYFTPAPTKDEPMRFEPFRANYLVGTRSVTLIGGGYYRQTNGKKFFLKDFFIEGIDGYTWNPSYPGTDVSTTAFGIGGYGYVMENTSKGMLRRFNNTTVQWESINTVPIAKEANFVSFDVGERAFILPEFSNWNENLDVFYEYLPTNQWKAVAPFKGENRRRGLSFTYNGKLYYGAGQSTKTLRGLRDIWEYDPTTNNWRQVATYPGSGTINLTTIMIGRILYIGFGQQVIPNENKGETLNDVTDFWRFTIR